MTYIVGLKSYKLKLLGKLHVEHLIQILLCLFTPIHALWIYVPLHM